MKKRPSKKNLTQAEVFDVTKLQKELQREARVVGLSENSAELVAKRVAEKVTKWAEGKDVITEDDLHRRIAREARQYSQDLAYVYENRGKII